MRIFTFYDDVPELERFSELKLITLWRERWNAKGLEPFVLNMWHAQKHPMYEDLVAAVKDLPSSNPKNYEFSCFVRWLALAQVGGGYLMDYDVMPNYVQVPGVSVAGRAFQSVVDADLPAKHEHIRVYQTPCCPALAYAPKQYAEWLCQSFIEQPDLGDRPQANRGHYSDQYHLESLVMAKADWVSVRDVVKLWSDIGWKEAPLIHFANAVLGPAKKLPRWRNIPELLP